MVTLDAIKKAAAKSTAEGEYGRRGWFTAWDVREFAGCFVTCADIRRFTATGKVVEGTWDDSTAVSTSAIVFRMAE